MIESTSIEDKTSEMLKRTHNFLIAEVARKLLVLENLEDIYLCDFYRDSVSVLHKSFIAINQRQPSGLMVAAARFWGHSNMWNLEKTRKKV